MNALNKLSLKNLRLNKSRTVVTIIGILLSAALITVVAGVASSGQQTMLGAEINYSGDYDLMLNGNITSGDIDDISANRNVSQVFVKDTAGLAHTPAPKTSTRPYVYIQSLSTQAYTNCFKLPLESGRYPQNSSELVLTQEFIENSTQEYRVGDTLTLEIGERKTSDGEVIPLENNYGETVKEVSDGQYETVSVDESFDVQSKHAYKIVGILGEYNSRTLNNWYCNAITTVFTAADTSNLSDNASLIVKFTEDGEKHYLKTSSQILGISEEDVKAYIEASTESNKSKFDSFDVNTSLLTYKGYAVSDSTLSMLYRLAAIIIAIVIIASVFVIRNSFAISITEKTRLYGMLSSIGATSRQIRHNVLFEGFVLALIGIPLGILLGVGVVAVLIAIINVLLADSLNGVSFVYSVPFGAIIIAAVLSMATILLSTLGSALRASKISPIDAVRGNLDIKIKKKPKAYNSPKFIKKLFGTGGEIAYKNLKRSKKKYRTTVISIVVSVAVFISVSSFIQYGTTYSTKYYYEIGYNLSIYSSGASYDSYEELNSVYEKIASFDGIENQIMSCNAYLNIDNINGNKKTEDVLTTEIAENSDNNSITNYSVIPIVALDDEFYKKALNELNISYEDAKDKAIIINGVTYYDDEGNTVKGELFQTDAVKSMELETTGDKNGDNFSRFEIKIAKTAKNCEALEDYIYLYNKAYLLVSADTFSENIDIENAESQIYINAENPDELEETINESFDGSNLSVNNIAKQADMMNSYTLVISIFAYGFIIVISLIGITNIFNTITTNMQLRSKEFAMLKSIGMTRREFNRMIRLESLFYGVKSLIIGIPLGLLAGFGMYKAYSEPELSFIIPYLAILISVVFVLAVVWLIMRFSISKVQKQNIIETIRNDNI